MRCLLFLMAIVAHLWLLDSLYFHTTTPSHHGQSTQPQYQSVTLTRPDDVKEPSSETDNHLAGHPDRRTPLTAQEKLTDDEAPMQSEIAAHTPDLTATKPSLQANDNSDQQQSNTTQTNAAASAVMIYAYRLNAPDPVYPEKARRFGYQGNVLLNLLVGAGGSVEKVRLLQSSGYTILDEAAISSLSDWLFVPTMLDGEPVAYWYAQYVAFQLTPAGQAEVSS